MSSVSLPDQWLKAIQQIVKVSRSITLILGGADTGKTTFGLALAKKAATYGSKVGFVDADIGQSTYGPPTTISLTLISGKVSNVRTLRPAELYFVGDITPRGHLLEMVVGIKKMLGRAKEAGCKVIVVDSCGTISAPLGEALKYRYVEITNPTHIVALQRVRELEPLLESVPQSNLCFLRLGVGPEVRTLSRSQRVEIRKSSYKCYFASAKPVKIALSKVAIFPPGADLASSELTHLLVGVKGKEGKTEAVGILTNYLREVNRVELLTPFSSPEKAGGLVLGCLKVEPNGQELGRVPVWRLGRKAKGQEEDRR